MYRPGDAPYLDPCGQSKGDARLDAIVEEQVGKLHHLLSAAQATPSAYK